MASRTVYSCGCAECGDIFYLCERLDHQDYVAMEEVIVNALLDQPASSARWEGIGVSDSSYHEETGAQVLTDITKKGMPFPKLSQTMKEVIVTDPTTGGKKGQKLERFDLIPNEFEIALARHYGKGAEKYEDRNWEKGYRWSLSVGALRRHLAAWLGGEQCDAETGSNHLIAVAWHACALYIFELRRLGTDDIRTRC